MLDIRTFGDQLIRTGDLDPVYFVKSAGLDESQMCRWLLAYWCFYHVGVASWLSEQEGVGYWNWMLGAARNDLSPRSVVGPGVPDRWPRAPERRHFRGDKCVRAVEWLRDHYSVLPEDVVRWLVEFPPGQDRCDERFVMNRVLCWPMFGPWIAFKAADMMERVYGAPIQFSRDLGLMYEEPRAGLRLAIDHPLHEGRYNTLADCYEQLLKRFGQVLAPPDGPSFYHDSKMGPGGRRSCGPQEVETVLCKWKSHVSGKYWVGKDIHEVRAACVGWGATADQLLAVLPGEVAQ